MIYGKNATFTEKTRLKLGNGLTVMLAIVPDVITHQLLFVERE